MYKIILLGIYFLKLFEILEMSGCILTSISGRVFGKEIDNTFEIVNFLEIIKKNPILYRFSTKKTNIFYN